MIFLKKQGIGTLGVGLIPNHKYPRLGLNFSLPETERYLAQQIRIPCNAEITDEEQGFVIEKIKEFYEK